MCIERTASARKQAGLSLVELIMFIVIVGAGLAGILSVMNMTSQRSADPMLRKQALAIAESLLEEIQLMPFTYCDPDDPQASTALSATVGAPGVGCSAGMVEAIGPEAGETRYATPRFDNVNDYDGYSTAVEVPTGIKDINATPIPGLAAYNAAVAIGAVALGGIAASDANGQAQVLRIVVTVTPPSGPAIALEGYRTKYAPQATP
jgi:MSHA pilin protein MshD